MHCDNLNKIIIGALVLMIVADVLALYAELESEKCEKIAEQERRETMEKMQAEINTLKEELSKIK